MLRARAVVEDGGWRSPVAKFLSESELSAANDEYAEGSMEHPDEHPLALGERHLRDLLTTVNAMAAARVVGVSLGSRAMNGIFARCSRAG